jgi:hypothetical protein
MHYFSQHIGLHKAHEADDGHRAKAGKKHGCQVAARHGTDSQITQIEIRSDGESLSVQSFGAGRIIIGRSPDNEIYVKSKFVSRHHAQLVSDDDGCVIEDLNSTNGVFIDEKQVKKHRLKNGETVSLGVHDLVYTDLRQVVSIKPVADDIGGSDDEISAAGE